MNGFAYELTADASDRFEISFRNGSPNLIGLRMGPSDLEPMLSKGKWLVLAFAVWDASDRPAISIAAELADQHDTFRVGVRPFELGTEFATWAGDFRSDAGSLIVSESDRDVVIGTRRDDHPVWVSLRDGVVTAALVGVKDIDSVREFVTSYL